MTDHQTQGAMVTGHERKAGFRLDMAVRPGESASVYIQQAVDEAHRQGGGQIVLGEGVFELEAPVHLKDHVHLSGSGAGTVLRKCPGYAAAMSEDADYGETSVQVKDASGFAPGMSIHMFDGRHRYGWDEFTGTITSVEGNRINFQPYLWRDYSAAGGGTVTNAGSLISGSRVSRCSVADMVIDGQAASQDLYLGGCRGGGIYLYNASHCRIERVHVRNFAGDGISWQMTDAIHVKDCVVEGCYGSGMHPGAGSFHSIIEHCRMESNHGDGLYVCWRVQQGRFSRNCIDNNKGYGISIGHKDTHNDFSENHIVGNKSGGILFRPEREGNSPHYNTFRANHIIDNCRTGIQIHGSLRGLSIIHNRIRHSEDGPQTQAIAMTDPLIDSVIEHNDTGFANGKG